MKEPKTDKNKITNITFISILCLGILAIILLSLNFKHQLKDTEQTPKESILQQEESKPINIANETKDSTQKNHQIDNSCKDMLSFIQDYYNMKIQAEEGSDFSYELIELNKYKIKSSEIQKHLDILADLAKLNAKQDSFKKQFNQLIRDLYTLDNSENNSFYNLLIKIIFIRPIGERAIANGGFDKEIALTEKALMSNDLNEAKLHIMNLPDKLESLKDLQIQIQNKLSINESIESLGKILISRIDCNEVKQ
jgi:hypothetical protein